MEDDLWGLYMLSSRTAGCRESQPRIIKSCISLFLSTGISYSGLSVRDDKKRDTEYILFLSYEKTWKTDDDSKRERIG